MGSKPAKRFLILVDGVAIGQIQMYRIDDYPEYKKVIDVNESAAGVDLFIGEKEYLHKGFGSVIIKHFLNDYVFTKFKVGSCIMGPNPNNIAAIKAYQKVGLVHLKTIFNPEENEEEYLMKIEKETIKNSTLT